MTFKNAYRHVRVQAVQGREREREREGGG